MTVDDIRQTEATIRKTEADVSAELADLRRKSDEAQQADVAAYAEAMAAGAAVPKPKAPAIAARIKDIETRVLPGTDEALWVLVGRVVEAVQPDVDPDTLRRHLKRWAPPKLVRDPSGVLPGPRTHDPRDAARPRDIVDWTLARIDAVARGEQKQRTDREKEERYREALRRVNLAQAQYEREQREALDAREAAMTPTARNAFRIAQAKSQNPPWQPFDRRAFLEREGLLEDYGWVQGGNTIEVKGGRETRIEQVPRDELSATNATEA